MKLNLNAFVYKKTRSCHYFLNSIELTNELFVIEPYITKTKGKLNGDRIYQLIVLDLKNSTVQKLKNMDLKVFYI